MKYKLTLLISTASLFVLGSAMAQDSEDKRTPIDKRSAPKSETPNTAPKQTDQKNSTSQNTAAPQSNGDASDNTSALAPDSDHGVSVATAVGIGGGKSKSVSFDRLSFNGQVSFQSDAEQYLLRYQSITSVDVALNQSIVHQMLMIGMGFKSSMSLFSKGHSNLYITAGAQKSNGIQLDEDQVRVAKWAGAANVTAVDHLPLGKNLNLDIGINATITNFFWADAQIGISALL